MLIIAHRGASLEAPESTEAAIRLAVARRADMVELDVQLTRDERLVIFHDDLLDRTSTGRGRLTTWRYPSLSRLDSGAWFSSRFAGQKILLVSQAIRLIAPPVRINLEIKSPARLELVVNRLLRCVAWTKCRRRVLLSSFDPDALRVAQRLQPSIARALLCKQQPLKALRTAARLGCVAVHPHVSLITASLVRRIHDAGLRVHVWTVDRVAEARRLARLGVDGVFTNAPERLRALRSP